MFSFESSSLSPVPVAARERERRCSRRDLGARSRSALLTIGADLDTRLETGGTVVGTTGTAMLGGRGGGILAALPMPLGSLTELLRPPTLPGPRGIPLTPASCANDGMAASKQPADTKAKNHDLPNMIASSRKHDRMGPGFAKP
jgi:hypothetical protein